MIVVRRIYWTSLDQYQLKSPAFGQDIEDPIK